MVILRKLYSSPLQQTQAKSPQEIQRGLMEARKDNQKFTQNLQNPSNFDPYAHNSLRPAKVVANRNPQFSNGLEIDVPTNEADSAVFYNDVDEDED